MFNCPNSALMSGSSSGRPEKYGAQLHSSRAQVQYQEPQIEIVWDDTPMQFVVKWFNSKRGFGFVILSDGSGEAFLHRNVLARAGIDAVEPDAVLKVRV